MSRQLLFQGKVHRLEVPRPLDRPKEGFALGLTWRLAGTALLGLVAAGIVALVGHGGRDPGPKQAALTTPAPKPAPAATAPKARPQPEVALAERVVADRSTIAAPAPPPPAVLAPKPASNPVLPPAPATASPPPSAAFVAEPPPPAPVITLPPVGAAAPVSPPMSAGVGSSPNSAPALGATLDRPGEPAEAPAPADVAKTDRVSAGADTPVGCLPGGLRRVLTDVGSRFGAVTLVSTTHLHTDNHSRGSARDKLHQACKAVDFKVQGADVKAVIAFLRSRTEVNGINSYRGSLIHVDASASAGTKRAGDRGTREAAVQKPARKATRARSRFRRAGRSESPEPAAPEAASSSVQ